LSGRKKIAHPFDAVDEFAAAITMFAEQHRLSRMMKATINLEYYPINFGMKCVSGLISVLDAGGWRAAAMYTLIGTAKLKGIDPQAWLADVLRRIADHPASRLHELLPWNWKLRQIPAAAA
jgi:IS66 C-terminal element